MDAFTLFSLPPTDIARLKNSAKIAQSLEDQWADKIGDELRSFTSDLAEKIQKTGKIPEIDLGHLFIQHFFEVSIKSMRYAETEAEEFTYPRKGAGIKFANLPKVKIPKSLEGLMKLYDLWKRGRYTPNRPKAQAVIVQKEYLKKVRSVWEKYSNDFRTGDVATQELVVKKIQDAAETTISRAKTIVRTETTSYYNQARKEFYDQSEDITHYLFIAIRDAGTSPWCSPKTVNGYRGRSGLVYAKSDPLCKKECPACHPGCRSEFLPLSRLNPAHLKFIQDEKIQRRNNTCFPLLKNWKAA